MTPELQRSLWTDATPRRLARAGAAAPVAFALVWLVDRGRHAFAATLAGGILFAFAGLAWAPSAARRSVVREALADTWDHQRLSALAPWETTWGRLAGATLRPWTVAGGGLLIAALQLASTTSLRHALFWMLMALALAAALQAAALATGLLDIRRARASGRPLSARAPGLAVLALGLLTLGALAWAWTRAAGGVEAAFKAAFGLPLHIETTVGWFGHAVPVVAFAALTLTACAAWTTVWAWRLMRLELQLANAPWAWCAFVLGAAVYAAGFDPAPGLGRGGALAARLVGAAFALALLAYVAAFAEPADRIRARQFAEALARREPGRAATRLPLIVWPSLLAVLADLATAAIHARTDEAGEALFTLALLAFFLRDLGVIAWRRFARGRAPGDLSVILTLAALYVLGTPLGWLFGRTAGQAAFLPSPALPGLSAGMGLFEALAIWGLAARRISRPTRAGGSPRPARALRPASPAPPPRPEGEEDPPPPRSGEGGGEAGGGGA